MRTLASFTILSAAAVALGVGCSLINSLDEVTSPPTAGYAAVGPKLEQPLGEGGPAASDGGEGGVVGDRALLVVGGFTVAGDAGTQSQTPTLAVIDSVTGREVGSRETMHVAGVVYDAPTGLWYIFEAPSYFVANPSDVVRLHVRRLDLKTGAWTELSNTVVPPLVFYDAIVATNARLTFVAHPAEGGSAYRMVTLDLSNPAAPTVLDEQDLTQLPIGIMGTRSATGPGGRITLVNVGTAAAGDCADSGPQSCAAKLRRFLIPNGGAPQDLGTFLFGTMSSFGTPGFGVMPCGGPDELLVLPRNGAGPHDVHLLNYLATEGVIETNFAMLTGATRLRRAAVDNQRRLVFIVETNTDTNLYAIPLDGDGGATAKGNLRHSGQSVYYDEASKTIFAPFKQGDGHSFSAFRVTGTAIGPDKLHERSSSTATPPGDWDPPDDLHPVLLGVREPTTPTCP